MKWDWIGENAGTIENLLGQHLCLAFLPVAIGLAIALPVGMLAVRHPRLYPSILMTGGILYSVPSLALFIVLPSILGTRILDPINIIVALTFYAMALLIRSVVDGLRSVPDHVTQAASAIGYRRYRQLLQVELPIALPVIASGVRVVTVSTISLVSVGALIGTGGLGELFTQGFQLGFLTPIVVGGVLSVAITLLADGLLLFVQRILTPWARAGSVR
ncbi:ABC transporter permease [Streptomyces sp. NPDC088846]|uniref:ABC transporter permease n=1 Tax=Streptomyces sp. NPDC088846 TaxID=3365908 RepID=UPI00382290AD